MPGPYRQALIATWLRSIFKLITYFVNKHYITCKHWRSTIDSANVRCYYRGVPRERGTEEPNPQGERNNVYQKSTAHKQNGRPMKIGGMTYDDGSVYVQ